MRSTRNVLTAFLLEHGGQMDDEMLRTLLTEIEMVINSCPLTYPSMHPADAVEPLTLNQSLTQNCSVVLPPPGSFPNPDLYSRQRWRKVQHVVVIPLAPGTTAGDAVPSQVATKEEEPGCR